MKRLAIVCFLCACSTSSNDKLILAEAAEIHEEALEIAHQTALRISQFKRLEDQMTEAGRDSLQAIAEGLGEWYELLVEVPGRDHDHHGHDHGGHDHGEHEGHDHDDHEGHDHGHDHEGHDHDHNHSGTPNYMEALSAQEILEIQAGFKREVEHLQGRLMQMSRQVASNGSQ